MNALQQIDAAAEELSRARQRLEDLLESLQGAVQTLERQRLPQIRRTFENAAALQSEFVGLIDTNRPAFERPKSRVASGLKFGLRKGKGGIDFEDEEQIIKLIEKKLPEELHDQLIKTKKSVLKGGLNQLDVKDLKAIGCTVEDAGDVVFVQPLDSVLKKQIDRLLKDATDTGDVKLAA